eukprot:TRINITY_DN5613_c0_g1_i1.p1 TRINITY_DN5613_c0_g1~~TRINITY_DN5613_c0_g1_i1.p1  ORF type:complete len:422 (+),score=33.16 TRINITY_DN5613_c0_g1_i1:215-1480(+)
MQINLQKLSFLFITLGCEDKRPCSRCTRIGKEASCNDIPRKKRSCQKRSITLIVNKGFPAVDGTYFQQIHEPLYTFSGYPPREIMIYNEPHILPIYHSQPTYVPQFVSPTISLVPTLSCDPQWQFKEDPHVQPQHPVQHQALHHQQYRAHNPLNRVKSEQTSIIHMNLNNEREMTTRSQYQRLGNGNSTFEDGKDNLSENSTHYMNSTQTTNNHASSSTTNLNNFDSGNNNTNNNSLTWGAPSSGWGPQFVIPGKEDGNSDKKRPITDESVPNSPYCSSEESGASTPTVPLSPSICSYRGSHNKSVSGHQRSSDLQLKPINIQSILNPQDSEPEPDTCTDQLPRIVLPPLMDETQSSMYVCQSRNLNNDNLNSSNCTSGNNSNFSNFSNFSVSGSGSGSGCRSFTVQSAGGEDCAESHTDT